MKAIACVGSILIMSGFTASAQEIIIDSIAGNGTMSFSGVEIGTTSTVEWAASLTEPGRTNWHTLTNIVITSSVTTNDIPMFFRVRGVPIMPEAWYPFNGNALDASGHGHNGIVYEATLTSDRYDAENAAYYFDGINDRISVANSSLLNITGALTIVAWINPQTVNANAKAWVSRANTSDNRSQWRAGLWNDTGDWTLTWWNGSVWRDKICTNKIPSSVWSHVVITADPSAGTIRFYRDGTLRQEMEGQVIDFQSSEGMLYIGHQRDNNYYFNGKIDDVRIYDWAMSDDEIYKLFMKAP